MELFFHSWPYLLFEMGCKDSCSTCEKMLTHLAMLLYDPRKPFCNTESVSLSTGYDSKITDRLQPIPSRFI